MAEGFLSLSFLFGKRDGFAPTPPPDIHLPEGLGVQRADGTVLLQPPSHEALQKLIQQDPSRIEYFPFPLPVTDEMKSMDADELLHDIVIPHLREKVIADAQQHHWGKIGVRSDAVSI